VTDDAEWSRSGREFQVRVENCRRCIAGGVPNASWCTCTLSLIADLGRQVSEVRHSQSSTEAAYREESRWLRWRLFGRDDPERYPDEAGMMGDLSDRLDTMITWLRRGAFAMGGVVLGLVTFGIEQLWIHVFH
jgi:hypothetical protein